MRYCEVGNHEIAQDEDDHRCFHCNRIICKAHMGNPDGLPGDLVACVDHVAEVKRKEAQLRLRRLRNQQEPTPTHDGKLDEVGTLTVKFEQLSRMGQVVEISQDPRTWLWFTPQQALSLLAWLLQEKATLEQLAKEQA